MKKILTLVLLAGILSGCAIFYPHKNDVEQGNVITAQEVSRLHVGMSEADVKEVMGDPVAVDIFNDNRLNYVYTMKIGYKPMTSERVICVFNQGRLSEIQRS